MKIGILQTGCAPDEITAQTGDYPDMFQRLLQGHGFTFQTWAVVDGIFPDGPDDADGWLITGSKHGVYEDHAWLPPLEDLIRAIVAADRPLIGVCFGHQIIAQALGGTVAKFDGGWAVGAQRYQTQDGEWVVNAWHQDQVLTAPEGAEVVASNAFCRNAALVYPGKAYTVQPHPEFDDAVVAGLIASRGPGVVPEDQLSAATQALGSPLSSADLARQFALFFTQRRLA